MYISRRLVIRFLLCLELFSEAWFTHFNYIETEETASFFFFLLYVFVKADWQHCERDTQTDTALIFTAETIQTKKKCSVQSNLLRSLGVLCVGFNFSQILGRRVLKNEAASLRLMISPINQPLFPWQWSTGECLQPLSCLCALVKSQLETWLHVYMSEEFELSRRNLPGKSGFSNLLLQLQKPGFSFTWQFKVSLLERAGCNLVT